MEMADLEQEPEKAAPPPQPEREQEEAGAPQNPLELAGAMGNSAVQQVAGSEELQNSPAAAGLMGPESYRPGRETEAGDGGGGGGGHELLSHELGHVVQQREGR